MNYKCIVFGILGTLHYVNCELLVDCTFLMSFLFSFKCICANWNFIMRNFKKRAFLTKLCYIENRVSKAVNLVTVFMKSNMFCLGVNRVVKFEP